MIMDNFSLDVTGRDDDGLRLALELAFLGHSGRASAACWREDVHRGVSRLVFSSSNTGDGWHPLPALLSAGEAATMASRWLEAAARTPQPDHDGDNVHGWRVVVGPWGRIEPYSYGAFVSVMPAWAMLGK